MAPDIDEDGKFLSHWLENLSNHTWCVFHSRKSSGRRRSAASHRRSDRNAGRPRRPGGFRPKHSGARVWPPMIHHTSREATFVFDFRLPLGTGRRKLYQCVGNDEHVPRRLSSIGELHQYLLAARVQMSTVKCRTRMKPIAAPNARGRTSQLLDFPTRLTRQRRGYRCADEF